MFFRSLTKGRWASSSKITKRADFSEQAACFLEGVPGYGVERDHTMSGHKFKVGQAVAFLGRERVAGAYKVTQLMPSEDGDHQYRIRNVSEPHDRVVKESDLSRAA